MLWNPTRSREVKEISYSVLFFASLLPHVNEEVCIIPTFEQTYEHSSNHDISSQPWKQVRNVRLQPYGCNLINCEFFCQEVADFFLNYVLQNKINFTVLKIWENGWFSCKLNMLYNVKKWKYLHKICLKVEKKFLNV